MSENDEVVINEEEELKKWRINTKKKNRGFIPTGPTDRQKKAVLNLVSGKFNTVNKAFKDAGYTRQLPLKRFLKEDGVRQFLQSIDTVSISKYGVGITEKIIGTYLEALDAEKIVGRMDMVVPDHKIRVDVATRMSEIMGIKPVSSTFVQNNTVENKQQFNYFSTNQEEKKKFNQGFIDFVNNYQGELMPSEGARPEFPKSDVDEPMVE